MSARIFNTTALNRKGIQLVEFLLYNLITILKKYAFLKNFCTLDSIDNEINFRFDH